MKKILPFAALALVFCMAPAALAGPGAGSPAPDFSLLDVNGKTHRLSDYEGKVILLNFWASW